MICEQNIAYNKAVPVAETHLFLRFLKFAFVETSSYKDKI